MKDFETSAEKRGEHLEKSLRRATGEELRYFLRREFKRNSNAERRFLLWFGESGEENKVKSPGHRPGHIKKQCKDGI